MSTVTLYLIVNGSETVAVVFMVRSVSTNDSLNERYAVCILGTLSQRHEDRKRERNTTTTRPTALTYGINNRDKKVL